MGCPDGRALPNPRNASPRARDPARISNNHRAMKLHNLRQGFRLSILAAVVCGSAVFAQSPAPAAPAGAGQSGQAPAPVGRGQGRGPAFPPVVIGPPAPVPPEVALPTAAEVTQMNDAMKKFIGSDKSAAAPLLKRYEHVVLLPPFRVNTAATYTQTVQRMGPRHEGFVERARQGNIDLLLHGDSITDWWVQNDENKAMFDKYFGEHQDGELRHRRRHDARRALGPAQRRRPGLSAQGGHADDRHEQRRRQHRAGNRRGHRRRRARDAAATFRTRRSCCSRSSRAAAGRSRARQDRARSTGSSRGSTIRSTCSSWTSARSSWTRKASSCPTRSGPTTCTRWRRATTSGARPFRPSWRSC